MISIIVPVYNNATSLSRCIGSIIGQTYQDWELILVNDGSTDESLAVGQSLMSEDRRIQLYTKANGGVSSARNLGLEKSTGEYVVFVDSDDWVAPDFLQTLVDKRDSDVVISSFVCEYGDHRKEEQLRDEYIHITSSGLNDILMHGAVMTVWGKLLKKDIIKCNKLRFDERIDYGEDSLFMFEYLLNAKTMCWSPCLNYHYCITQSGLSSRKLDVDKGMYILDRFLSVLNDYKNKYTSYDFSHRYIWLVYEFFLNFIEVDPMKGSFKERKRFLKHLLTYDHMRNLLNDKVVLSKGVKRRLWEFLALHEQYTILTLYSYYYMYN